MNERGYWVEGEPRPGVSDEDPRRYRRHTMQDLVDAGYALDPGLSMDQAAADLYVEKHKAIREFGSRGAAADVGIQAAVTRHTILGRRREIKRMAYYSQRQEVEDGLQAAGLSEQDIGDALQAWDDETDIRVVESRDRGELVYTLYDDHDKTIGRPYTWTELEDAAILGTAMEDEFREYRQREQMARELTEEIEAQGLTVSELGFTGDEVAGMLDEVRDAFLQHGAVISAGDEWEDVDLEDLPF